MNYVTFINKKLFLFGCILFCICSCANCNNQSKEEAKRLNREIEQERGDTRNTIDRALHKKLGPCTHGHGSRYGSHSKVY